MKLSGKKKILLCASLVCMMFSSILFANGTKFLTISSGEATARANVSFVNGGSNERADFVGYGGRISGRDADAVRYSNAAILIIQGNSSGGTEKRIWYGHSINSSKLISKKNTQVSAKLQFENKKCNITVK